MKKILLWLGLAIIELIGILISVSATISIINSSTSLDTRKIHEIIDTLRKQK